MKIERIAEIRSKIKSFHKRKFSRLVIQRSPKYMTVGSTVYENRVNCLPKYIYEFLKKKNFETKCAEVYSSMSIQGFAYLEDTSSGSTYDVSFILALSS